MAEAINILVGESAEIVRPMRLDGQYCMICNDGGQAQGRPVNPLGCYLYGDDRHGYPVCGAILIMREDRQNGALMDMSDDELETLEKTLQTLMPVA